MPTVVILIKNSIKLSYIFSNRCRRSQRRGKRQISKFATRSSKWQRYTPFPPFKHKNTGYEKGVSLIILLMLRGFMNYYFYLLLDIIFEIPHMYSSLKDAEKAIEKHELQTNSNFCTYRVDKNYCIC